MMAEGLVPKFFWPQAGVTRVTASVGTVTAYNLGSQLRPHEGISREIQTPRQGRNSDEPPSNEGQSNSL